MMNGRSGRCVYKGFEFLYTACGWTHTGPTATCSPWAQEQVKAPLALQRSGALYRTLGHALAVEPGVTHIEAAPSASRAAFHPIHTGEREHTVATVDMAASSGM
ncbi:hypothetical protein SRHO_G00299720 [Serrasalmus rhombeus]